MATDRIQTTIEVLIVALANASQQVARCADMAETSISSGHRNQAIGALLEAETAVKEIPALFAAIRSIHISSSR